MMKLRATSKLPQSTQLGDRFQVVKFFYGNPIYLDGVVTSIPTHRRFGVVTYGDNIRETWPIERSSTESPTSDNMDIFPETPGRERSPFQKDGTEARSVSHEWQKKLRPLRIKRGMRQSDIANRLNIPTMTYGNWERCTRTAPLCLMKTIFPELNEAVGKQEKSCLQSDESRS